MLNVTSYQDNMAKPFMALFMQTLLTVMLI